MLSEAEEKRKKILFVLPTLHAGGSENYALRFIKQDNRPEVIWHVWSANAEQGDFHDLFDKAGCHIHYGSIGYYHPKRFYRFYRFLQRESFGVVCTFNGNFGGIALTIARLAGVKIRIAWHRRSTNAFGTNPMKLFFNGFANKLIRLNATKILSNSQYALDQFYEGYWEKDKRFKVIPNGVDASLVTTDLNKEEARKILGVPTHVKIIGHVGRFAEAKNHDTIFKVAAKLINELNQDVYFLFCGKFTDAEAFKTQLNLYKISDRSFPIGLTDKLPLVYKAIDIFYFPSVTEGQPNALIEAMLANLPVLPSNIPSIQEMLPADKQDITVAPNDVEDATEHLFQMLNSKVNISDYQFREWALEQFNPEKKFSCFKNEIDPC